MTTDTPEDRIHPAGQFLILAIITIGLMFVGSLLGAAVVFVRYGLQPLMDLIHNGISTQLVNQVWILQLFSTTFPFFAAPYIFAKFVVKQPHQYLKANVGFNPLLILGVFAVMFFSMPLMEVIINLNQKMVLPSFLKGLEKWMHDSEAEAAKETAVLLNLQSLAQMLWALLVIGLLTAISEEFFFRGCIQTIFTRWTSNPHWGIWIAAILFSAIHMQFYGFLPRMLLGVFFGYVVLWSGSIWASVWGHFINNGTAVIVTYLYQNKKISLNPDDQHVFNYGAYAFSLIITVFLCFVCKRVAESKKQLPELP